MWQTTKWIDENNKKHKDCFILINLDKNGNELQRAGNFDTQSVADGMVRYLNSLEVHQANVFANYIGIDSFLHTYVAIQDRLKEEEKWKEERLAEIKRSEKILEEAVEETKKWEKAKW